MDNMEKMTGYDLLLWFINNFKTLSSSERKQGYSASFNVLQKHFPMRHPYWRLKRLTERLYEQSSFERQGTTEPTTGGDREKEYLVWKYDQVDTDIYNELSFLVEKVRSVDFKV